MAAHQQLTKRQLQVLVLSAEGHSAKSIAKLLKLSMFTVRDHLKETRQRLHCRTITQAVAWLERRDKPDADHD